jgi:hypothetical protein
MLRAVIQLEKVIMMKQKFLTISSLVAFLLLTACQQTDVAVQTVREPLTLTGNADTSLPAQQVSCTAAEETSHCQDMEASILAATVRLELEAAAPDQSQTDLLKGHATIKDGRYLITHNHYGLTPEDIASGKLIKLSIFKADGTMILKDVPYGAFEAAVTDPETLQFDFGDYGGQGLFGAIGMDSAEFRSWDIFALQPGMEVAQIDWDGTTAHVDWVRITAVYTAGDTPYLEVDNFVQQGASGGGVFYEGYHIGNNWFRSTDRAAETGEVLGQYSVAALNE